MVTPEDALKRNPTVEAILRFNEGRPPGLVRRKFERMNADIFAFFRGSDHLFGLAWPGLAPIDPGPKVLICGDLHLENFGAYRDEDGEFLYDINDFDEAIVAPCSVDLIRCSTSILLAAQVWQLSPIRAMRMVLGYLDHYRSTLVAPSEGERRNVGASMADEAGPLRKLLGKCAMGTQSLLLDRIARVDRSGSRTIRRSSGRLPAIDGPTTVAVTWAVEAYGASIGQADAFRVLDVSARIAGIGSLGVRRYVALVAGDATAAGNRLLDIKAAGPSALLGCVDDDPGHPWDDEASRVVDAQRRLQARPTALLDAIRIGDEGFRLREMIPEENRAGLDHFRRKPSKLDQAVQAAGQITARSHLRGARVGRGVDLDQAGSLERWAASPSLDAVLASAIRFAARTQGDFKAFRKARLDLEVG